MLIYGKSGILFQSKDLTCLLNDNFNLIVFSDYTAIQGSKTHSVGFSVPVKYFDFIKTISPSYTLDSNLKEIFKFKNEQDFIKLKEFVSKQPRESNYQNIQGLLPQLHITKAKNRNLKR